MWIEEQKRDEMLLLPERLEDYVGADNPVRVIEAFVEVLNLKELGFVFPKQDRLGRGRPAFHPASLLKLYLYGYSHGIRSSRKLEAECGRNLEVIWLMGKLKPDFKTIADFRKLNRKSFRNVMRQFTAFCNQWGLIGGELLAVDGTKIKAQNNPGRNFSLSKLNKQKQQIEERVDKYLKQLEEADAQESAASPAVVGQMSVAQVKQKLEQLKARKERCEQRLEALQKSGESQLSETDADSRAMGTGWRSVVGYNIQSVVDGKYKLMVETSTTNASSDSNQLAVMAQSAKQELNIEQAKVVADKAYYVCQDIKACEDAGLQPYVAAGKMSPSERKGLYGKSAFQYDEASDSYRCPAGCRLTRRRKWQQDGKAVCEYDAAHCCRDCPCKARCTGSSYRTLTRWEHEAYLERMEQRLKAEPQILSQRKELVEHPFGTIKQRILIGGFLVKGFEMVAAEVSLAHWAYNFKRLITIMGVRDLLKALRRKKTSSSFSARREPSYRRSWNASPLVVALHGRFGWPQKNFQNANSRNSFFTQSLKMTWGGQALAERAT